MKLENYKVHVSNEAESKEVQNLFFAGDCGWDSTRHKEFIPRARDKYPVWIQSNEFGRLYFCEEHHSGEIITIPQLRDLVVLHRNDVSDATHTYHGAKYYLTSNEFFEYINGKWVNVDEFVNGCNFSKITKEKIPYLVKTIDKWEEQQLTSDTPESATCLKIPDEAIELLYSESNNSKYHFVRLNGDLMSVADILDGEEYWYKDRLKYKNWGSVNVVWQRSPKTLPTQPEELPFIDDEPKMADIEQTLNERQSQ